MTARRELCACGAEVAMLPVVWGSERTAWPFELGMVPIADVDPSQRYVYSKRRGGVLALESNLPLDAPGFPSQVLVWHRCAEQRKRRADGRRAPVDQYTKWMQDLIDAKVAPGLGTVLMPWIKDGPPEPGPPAR